MQTAPQLQAIVTQIAHKHGVDLDRSGAYLRLALSGNGQLIIENIGAQRVSVTNYIEVNRDLVADPHVVLYTHYRTAGVKARQAERGWVPLEITEVFGGWKLYAEVDSDDNVIVYDPTGQTQLAELCDRVFARNIHRFGWLHLAQRATDVPKPWSGKEQ